MEDLETRRIYRSLFNRNPPAVILSRYPFISQRLNARVSRAELERYTLAIGQIEDLEALEVACRFVKKFPLLSWKFQAMVYLAETLPENQAYFVNEQTSFIVGGWQLFTGFLRSAYKLAKGFWLLARLKDA
jgi:hypothetical protein